MGEQDPESSSLGKLFSDAAADPPPASFGMDEISAASARATTRRRRAVAGVSTLGVVVLALGVVTGLTQFGQTGGDGQTVAAPKATRPASPTVHKLQPFELKPDGEDRSGPPEHAEPPKLPEASSEQGDEAPGNTGPRAGAPRPGCVNADRELATALAGELPAAPHQPARTAQVRCPAGARGVAYTLREGERSGTVSVVLAREALPRTMAERGASTTTETTRSGMSLLVTSRADAPSADAPLEYRQVVKIARGLAGRF